MKRLFFGPTNSTGIFHYKITKAIVGLQGCITKRTTRVDGYQWTTPAGSCKPTSEAGTAR